MVEKLCELLSRLSGAGEDSTSITSSGSSTALSTGWALGHITKLVTIHYFVLRGSVDTMGSPKKSDGNGMTWEPCEPLMNVYREKVAIVTDQDNLEENHFDSTENFFFTFIIFHRSISLPKPVKSNFGKNMGGSLGQVKKKY